MDHRKLYLKYSKAEDFTILIRGYGGDNLISPDGFPASGGLGGAGSDIDIGRCLPRRVR